MCMVMMLKLITEVMRFVPTFIYLPILFCYNGIMHYVLHLYVSLRSGFLQPEDGPDLLNKLCHLIMSRDKSLNAGKQSSLTHKSLKKRNTQIPRSQLKTLSGY